MQGVSKILVPVDFSSYSRETLRAAVELSKDLGAKLAVLNVINQRDVEAVHNAVKFGTTGGITENDFIERTTRERRELIGDMLIEAGADPQQTQVEIQVGVPAQEILEAVVVVGAHMVIMGTKGRTNLATALFGSTAERVFRRSPVTVVSVRGQEHNSMLSKVTS